MHLLAAQKGEIEAEGGAIDLGQSPGEIVFLSAADSDLACLAAAFAGWSRESGTPSLRLANLMRLRHNLSVDLYVERVIAHAKLIIVRLLGGESYWPYGLAEIAAIARQRGIGLVCLPGDDRPDPDLMARSTLPVEAQRRFFAYFHHGGIENARSALAYAAQLIGFSGAAAEPKALPRAGLYWPGAEPETLADLRAYWREEAPVAGLVFYRALLQSCALAPIDSLIAALRARGLNALPVFVNSLKDETAADLLRRLYAEADPAIVLNATGFALASGGGEARADPLILGGAPVLQILMVGETRAHWRESSRGLNARDLAMQVALPELDGRILTRAIAFKAVSRFDAATECDIVMPEPDADRIAFVADLAARWVRLRRLPAAERRLAMILANYPNRDERIGNGVGLDTPASAARLLRILSEAGYRVTDPPTTGAQTIARLLAGPTNARPERGRGDAARARLALADYRAAFARLPETLQRAISERWGAPETDPFFADDEFHLPLIDLGHVFLGIQPARGYNIDPAQTYHDPALVPPHGYFAFYVYLRDRAGIDAVIHLGKHGNLEWLPGKALALSAECYPEAMLGPLPHLYPFIVNDPGEGTQAKRRAGAVIIDHLTPPLARAESYGPLRDLERLIDEYFEAGQLDPRRLPDLEKRILDLAGTSGLAADCGLAGGATGEGALAKLDAYLCELKEMQIRDGLHVFGEAPTGELRDALIVALLRLPRGSGAGDEASLHRALAADLDLGADFDPLNAAFGDPWQGPRPAILAALDAAPWRTTGDTVERLEILALRLVAGQIACLPEWRRSRAILDFLAADLAPRLAASARDEVAHLLAGLAGRFVPPGPSGAPTRGRLDVLPTGRNFHSLDCRAVPTPSAWALGWKSAALLLERHRQDHGEWPRAIALSAWGTANMRTGGDDIAQALALIGAKPRWDDAGSLRVIGFEILPLSLLDRPRIDVTLRVSGFFRDAFPAQIDLFDGAIRAIAELDEPPSANPIAERYRAECAAFTEAGLDPGEAKARAGYRIFGSAPGTYGAGLQALIDERLWQERGDLAASYLAWSGYAYGGGAEGVAAGASLDQRLRRVEAVLHNQDNREHDLLDSDDYYQFEGGLAAAVRHLSGRKPIVWHNDHSRPEAPKIRSLEEEIARVVRARVVNPKWIAGVMRHGYKGAFEMAATVDYLFAFAATADCVADRHFDAVYAAYLEDEKVRDFLNRENPGALQAIAARLLEAQQRGLWQARSNSAPRRLADWAGERGKP